MGRVFLLLALSGPVLAADGKLDYARHVRPILADHCFQCHGPDEKARKGDLRLDTRDGLRAAKSIVAGQAAKSDLIARVTATDGERMPPPKTGKQLTAAQVATLKAWIDQGANWAGHWAFTRPVRPSVPATRFPTSNPIDAFIRARLEAEGITPAPAADRATLIRRVSLDLTGLPPTPAEVDAFVQDTSPSAYERLVDRLLASPRYGERMAWRWLEAGRYADTNGYQTDAGRDMWRWRDWVIEAYNRNLPFDRFTIEQIAGDMLPNPTLDQRIATGFNRNHRGNAEGGIVPEEYAVEYVADRVETTATVWLGLTFTCCRCHDHKYDPFSQGDFYRMFAYFNNIPEQGRAAKYGNSTPMIKAPTRDQERQLAALDAAIVAARRDLDSMQAAAQRLQAEWEARVDPKTLGDWSPAQGQVDRFSLDDTGSFKSVGAVPESVSGRLGRAMQFTGTGHLEAPAAGDFGFDDRFTISCWIQPKRADAAVFSRTVDDPRGEGYSVHLVDGRLQVHLTKRWLDDALRVETIAHLPLNQWTHVAVSYDASRTAKGTRVYINGELAPTRALFDELNQSFQSKEPFRIGAGGPKENRFVGLIDDVRIFDRAVEPAEARLLAVAETAAEIVRVPAAKRTAGQADLLRSYFQDTAGAKELQAVRRRLRDLRDERQRVWDSVSTVMVMEEMPTPRPAYILTRGEYTKKRERVAPGAPTTLNPLPTNAPNNRLGFAQWLVDPANPLTARVAVNRAWQMHFGVGLVKTTEDLGTQGEFPSHPDLLDWLAVEFSSDWDVKRLHRLIVTSATYQQTSQVRKAEFGARNEKPTPHLKDADGRLLSKFPRLRLSAEMVRDQALFASGLLVERPGGPSVRPYQPAGLWAELSGEKDYVADQGEGLYRRSLYTYWKRTAPPPVLSAFDAAGRETCWVRESRTNTPLQALALLNETGFVEAARVLAARAMREADTTEGRLTLAFQYVVSRKPSERELAVLRRGYERHRAEYQADPAAARKVLETGESKVNPRLDPVDLAGLAAVCNVVLNLDEAVTRE